MNDLSRQQEYLLLGLDVGSTTVKAAVVKPDEPKPLFVRYRRHHAEQMHAMRLLLEEVREAFPQAAFRIAVCGSGGKPIADCTGIHFVQEVVANASAVRHLYPQTRTAIELGGQDAKIIFFQYDENAGQLVTRDMRMNGSCAGGTGAFIDEIAALLKTPTEGFEALASQGETVHSISGRCGVFAKTDIQSVLNAGGAREDIALSAFHAIAKQTIGGLSQGLDITPPVIFEGGPLTFNPTLVRVFCERLQLSEDEIIRPAHPDTIVALGAALSIPELFGQDATDVHVLDHVIAQLRQAETQRKHVVSKHAEPYFSTEQACRAWRKLHESPQIPPITAQAGDTLRVYIGVDAGSTTSKLVLIDEQETVIDKFYANNRGDPIQVVRQGLMELYERYAQRGIRLEVLGLGTTGYGEHMLAKAFGADGRDGCPCRCGADVCAGCQLCAGYRRTGYESYVD